MRPPEARPPRDENGRIIKKSQRNSATQQPNPQQSTTRKSDVPNLKRALLLKQASKITRQTSVAMSLTQQCEQALSEVSGTSSDEEVHAASTSAAAAAGIKRRQERLNPVKFEKNAGPSNTMSTAQALAQWKNLNRKLEPYYIHKQMPPRELVMELEALVSLLSSLGIEVGKL